ncbi:enamine deaminase RidA (YjgF/YER057c/UK114 family) [Dyadobacter jejuensis]|uniref:Enamine deaminase RidA (YjgF/YER057c/UK114 family) n=1 Tax=Dyadobacter jejuensis TaxID=1082580 RepID=A0A316ANA3_9BACT|nr:RidA family protein [Dyadobacter jejuensis]PWJ58938.1 enamine deaminase RidA (YjgF/YER057c/UK114 family) [Dyadobacter jejuensis]
MIIEHNPEANFTKLGLALPPAPQPVGVYRPLLIVDNRWVYVSGHGPLREDGSLITGQIGNELNEEEGKQAAQQVGLAILATLKAQLGSLNRVKRVIKVLGMVNCSADFRRHPVIINGCSELFAQVWGEEMGVGARSAVGMGSLPDNISVEIEAMFELEEE